MARSEASDMNVRTITGQSGSPQASASSQPSEGLWISTKAILVITRAYSYNEKHVLKDVSAKIAP